MKTVLMKIHAGGAWEGHVVYVAINPDNPKDESSSSTLEEVSEFCKKKNLLPDKDFEKQVKEKLVYENKKGFIVPNQEIDPNLPYSSASDYIKKHFPKYI